VAGALLMMIFMGFAYAINGASNSTYQELAKAMQEEKRSPPAKAPTVKRPSPPARRPLPADRWESLLAAEISRGMVEVVDGNILRVSNSFPSGSDRVKKAYGPMLAKIAQELHNDNRLITVVGHTDNRPIFSARFPSNWHLSQARAKHVAGLLAASAPLEGRVRFEGHADSEPIAPNDTDANRARNRRIDIHIR
jgi:type VI secretion system protein ImpK